MKPVLVSGLVNLETTLQVDSFPVTYYPVRYASFGVNSTVSGVGFNIARALAFLGNEVRLLSLIGQDLPGQMVRATLSQAGLAGDYLLDNLAQTPQSVILYDSQGARQAHTDLKDIQEQDYPREQFEQALVDCSLAVLCNIYFSRPFLALARQAGVLVATDVHTISDLDDAYNRDFMQAADILFMSHERLPCPPEEWVHRVRARYDPEVLVIGMGSGGALLSVKGDGSCEHLPAVRTRPVVSTVGAGDALFSCFVDYYSRTRDPYGALRRAVVFASYKIGEASGSAGFLSAQELEELCSLSVPNF
jgi:acarbose 7IV-phosphotransferase